MKNQLRKADNKFQNIEVAVRLRPLNGHES